MLEETEQTVDAAACVEVVRALVQAFEKNGAPLQRNLRDEYDAGSAYLYPWRVEVSTEIVERGLKALGLPGPEAPKAKKIPALPSAAQARVLDYLNAQADTRLKSWTNWNGASLCHLMRPGNDNYSDETKVAKGTYEKLRAYKWIEVDRRDDGSYRPKIYYKLTDAGREALTRYQGKVGVLGERA